MVHKYIENGVLCKSLIWSKSVKEYTVNLETLTSFALAVQGSYQIIGRIVEDRMSRCIEKGCAKPLDALRTLLYWMLVRR